MEGVRSQVFMIPDPVNEGKLDCGAFVKDVSSFPIQAVSAGLVGIDRELQVAPAANTHGSRFAKYPVVLGSLP